MSPEDLGRTWSSRDPSAFETAATPGGRVAAIARSAALIRQWVKADDVVLDIGCGVGLLATYLDTVPIIGVDFSSALLSAARGRLPVMLGSVFALPIRQGAPAVVACLFVLDDYDTATKRRTLSLLASVLRPNGHLLIAGYAPDDERMGPRRGEVSAMEWEVYLEDEPFYRDALAAVGDKRTLSLEHIRTTAVVQPPGSSPMQRHFIVASVRLSV